MDDIPPRSYGQLIETTMRVITWNVWASTVPGRTVKQRSPRHCGTLVLMSWC